MSSNGRDLDKGSITLRLPLILKAKLIVGAKTHKLSNNKYAQLALEKELDKITLTDEEFDLLVVQERQKNAQKRKQGKDF